MLTKTSSLDRLISLAQPFRSIPEAILVISSIILSVYVGYAIPAGVILGVLLPISLLVFAFALSDFFIVLVGFAFLIPLEPFVLINEITLLRYLGPAVMAGWVVHRLVRREMPHLQTPAILLLLWISWGLVSVLWAPRPEALWLSYGQSLIQLGGLLVIFCSEIDSVQRLRWILGAFLTACMLLLLVSPFGTFSELGYLQLAAPTRGVGSTSLVSQIAFAVIALSVSAVYARGWVRMVSIPLLPLGVFVLLAIGVRGQALAAIGSLLGIFALQQLRKRRPGAVVPVIILFLSLQYVLNSGLIPVAGLERYALSAMLPEAGTARLRILTWESGLRTWVTRPITGVGLGNFRFTAGDVVVPKYRYMEVHSDYIRALVETGFVGAVLFFSAVILMVRSSLKLAWSFHESDYPMLTWLILGMTLYVTFAGVVNSLIVLKPLWLVWSINIVAERLLLPILPGEECRGGNRRGMISSKA